MELPQLTVANPLGAMAQAQQFQAGQQERAMRSQQMQEQNLQLEQQQRQMDSQQAMMQAYSQANGDLNKTLAFAQKSGKVLPGDLMNLQKTSLEMRNQALDYVQKVGAKAINDSALMQGAHDQVMAAPPEQRPAVYQQTLKNLQAAQVDLSGAPQQYPGDEAFAQMGTTLKTHDQLVKEAADQLGMKKTVAETEKDAAQANEATAQANKLTQEAQYGPSGPAAEAKYRFILAKAQAGKPLLPDEVSFAKGFEASNSKTTSTSDSLGVTSSNTSRPNGLALSTRGGGSPSAAAVPVKDGTGSGNNTVNGIVDMIGQYRLNPSMIQRMLTKHPEVLNAVQQKYPDFDQTTYNAKNKVVQDLTSGAGSREIKAINTVTGHLADLDQAVDALNNGNLTLLNQIGNKYGINVGGQTAASAFTTIMHRVGPEITTAYLPGGGGEAERFANEKDFSPNLPPQTLHNNIATTINLLNSKVGALGNQYKQNVGRDDFQQKFLTPQAQQAFQKYSGAGSGGGAIQASGIAVKAPNGKTYTFKDQAAANAFKQKAGIQ